MALSSATRLDQLPAVSGWVTKAGVHGAEAIDGFLRELHALGAHLLTGAPAIVHHQDQRRHRAFGHHRAQGLRRGGVVHRRPRNEQAELEGRLLRVLHRQPAVVTAPDVRVDAEPQLFHVKSERFVLIAHVQTDYFDALAAHWTSLFPGVVLYRPPPGAASPKLLS